MEDINEVKKFYNYNGSTISSSYVLDLNNVCRDEGPEWEYWVEDRAWGQTSANEGK